MFTVCPPRICNFVRGAALQGRTEARVQDLMNARTEDLYCTVRFVLTWHVRACAKKKCVRTCLARVSLFPRHLLVAQASVAPCGVPPNLD